MPINFGLSQIKQYGKLFLLGYLLFGQSKVLAVTLHGTTEDFLLTQDLGIDPEEIAQELLYPSSLPNIDSSYLAPQTNSKVDLPLSIDSNSLTPQTKLKVDLPLSIDPNSLTPQTNSKVDLPLSIDPNSLTPQTNSKVDLPLSIDPNSLTPQTNSKVDLPLNFQSIVASFKQLKLNTDGPISISEVPILAKTDAAKVFQGVYDFEISAKDQNKDPSIEAQLTGGGGAVSRVRLPNNQTASGNIKLPIGGTPTSYGDITKIPSVGQSRVPGVGRVSSVSKNNLLLSELPSSLGSGRSSSVRGALANSLPSRQAPSGTGVSNAQNSYLQHHAVGLVLNQISRIGGLNNFQALNTSSRGNAIADFTRFHATGADTVVFRNNIPNYPRNEEIKNIPKTLSARIQEQISQNVMKEVDRRLKEQTSEIQRNIRERETQEERIRQEETRRLEKAQQDQERN